MKKLNLITLALCLCCLSTVAANENISRLWLEFVEAQKSGGDCVLLDFSYAGYHHAEKGVPDVKHKVFNVCDYGAVANDNKSDRAAVEKAIAAATANGSGIVYFPKGRFDLNTKDDPKTAIVVNASNIVFKGEGMGEGGTEIFMEFPNPPVNPTQKWSSPTLLIFRASGSKAKITDVTGNSKRGSFSVEVASSNGIKAGDRVCLELKNNDPALIAEQLAPYEVDPKWTDLTKGGVQIQDFHLVTKVDGNTVYFKEPIMNRVDSRWGWFIRKYPCIEEVGVEDIAFTGNFDQEFVHHKDWLHDGGYKMFNFVGAVNSWVRRCRFTNVSECISFISSANVSLYNCIITGRTGHSAMRAQGSSRVFMGNVDDQPSQWHSLGISKPSMGNVLWRIKTQPNSCFESHASQPRATLFDACQGAFMRARAGGAESNNPNHMGDLFFWNYKQTSPAIENFDFWATDTPFWKFLPPVFVGFHGTANTFVQSQVRADESHGTPVKPESLYEAQLELRLGKLPKWLNDIKKELY